MKMKTKLLAYVTFLIAMIGSAQVLAHHSFTAEFDSKVPVDVTGIVVKVEWTNPHTYFYIEVEDEAGNFEEWAMELGSPNGLMRRGWKRDTLSIGTEVTVRGTRARDGSNKGNVQSVVLTETCQRLFAGTSQRNFVESEDAVVCE